MLFQNTNSVFVKPFVFVFNFNNLALLSFTHTHIDPEVVCTWSGQLPARRHKNPTFSPRVFLGGVPWDITEAGLLQTFQVFGNLVIDWPGKDSKHNRHPPKGRSTHTHTHTHTHKEREGG